MRLVVKNLDILERVKDRLGVLEDNQSFLKQISILMYKSVMQNFLEEGTDKEKWKKLSPMTIAMRRKKGKDAKILQDTGRLRNSIFPVILKDRVTVGTNLEYASIHQFGGEVRIPERIIYPVRKKALRFFIDNEEIFAKYVKQPPRVAKIPKRPFLWLRQEYKNRIFELAKAWINGKLQ